MGHTTLYKEMVQVGKKKMMLEIELYFGTEDVIRSHYREADTDTDPAHFQKDYDALIQIIGNDEQRWKEVFDSIPRKKDGSFAKSRVQVLYRCYSEQYEVEQSFGFKAPELRIESIDSNKAMVVFRTGMQAKYDRDNSGRFQSLGQSL